MNRSGMTIDGMKSMASDRKEKLHTRVVQYAEMTQSTQTNPLDGDLAKYQVSIQETPSHKDKRK